MIYALCAIGGAVVGIAGFGWFIWWRLRNWQGGAL